MAEGLEESDPVPFLQTFTCINLKGKGTSELKENISEPQMSELFGDYRIIMTTV